MKQGWKHFIMGASTMAILMGGLTFAANRSETVQRHFRNIMIELNGEIIVPKDANGKVVEPFLIDGTTYLPVRAVGEALGLHVGWNGDTNRVILSNEEIPVNNLSLMYQMMSIEDLDGTERLVSVPQIKGIGSEIDSVNAQLVEIYKGCYGNVSCASSTKEGVFSVVVKRLWSEGDGPDLYWKVYHFDAQSGRGLTTEQALSRIGVSNEEAVNRYNELLLALAPEVFPKLDWRNGYLGHTVNNVEEFRELLKQYAFIGSFHSGYPNDGVYIDENGNYYTWMPFAFSSQSAQFYAYEAIVNLTTGEIVTDSFYN